MPLDQFHLMLLTQIAENLPDPAAQRSEDHPFPVLWNKDDVVPAVPSDVGLALPFSHDGLLLIERGGSLKETVYHTEHDGTVEPWRVSPPKAVAYQWSYAIGRALDTFIPFLPVFLITFGAFLLVKARQ